MPKRLKYPYVQGDTEVDILQKNKENLISLIEDPDNGPILVDDTALIALQNDKI